MSSTRDLTANNRTRSPEVPDGEVTGSVEILHYSKSTNTTINVGKIRKMYFSK